MSEPQNVLVLAFCAAILLRFFWRALANLVGVTLLALMFVGFLSLVR